MSAQVRIRCHGPSKLGARVGKYIAHRFRIQLALLRRCLDGYSDFGLASGMFYILDSNGGYSRRDIALLTVLLIASLVDLLIAMASIFVPMYGGWRGVLLHLTTLLCETSILCITVIVLRSQLTSGSVISFNSTTVCALSSTPHGAQEIQQDK